MEREEMKGKITLTVIGALTLLVVLAGATFAYFSATSTSETRTITTSNLNLNVTANGDATHVSNIKPTAWTTQADADSNADIAKIPFKVTGTSSTNGIYTVNLQTSISLTTTQEQADGSSISLEGGSESDIKYRLYKKNSETSEYEEVLDEQSFAATVNTDIVTDGAITANQELNDEYMLYAYIKNDSANAQNKLQEVEFTITLGGSATQTAQ